MGPIALREQTAGRLLRRLGEVPGGAGGRGAGAGGYGVVLVRCTDAEPAAESGVGAECFPGVVVRSAASVAVPDQEDGGAVWLTVLSGTEAAEPAAGALYWCQLAGPVEIGETTRPRAFGTGPGSVAHGSEGEGAWNALTNGEYVSGAATITVPTAGTYLVWGSLTGNVSVAVQPNVSSKLASVKARLLNQTTGVAVPNTERTVCALFEYLTLFFFTDGGVLVHWSTNSATLLAVVEVEESTEFRIDVRGDWDSGGSAGVVSSQMGFVRLTVAGSGGVGGFSGTVGEG